MSELSQLLAETTDRILARRLIAPGIVEAEGLCGEVLDAGLHLVLVAESDGGAGGTLKDAAAIARIMGRHAAAMPFAEIVLAARMASKIGRPELIDSTLWAQWVDDTAIVPALPGLDRAMVTDRQSGSVWLVPAEGEGFTDFAGQACLRLSHDVLAKRGELVATPGDGAACLRDAMLLCAASALGAIEKVCDMVIDHAGTRSQFGRKIAAFQAIQHMIADIATEVALTDATLDAALEEDRHEVDRRLACYVAKLQSAQASGIVAANAHQIMGAIGYTEDHALHHFTRRLWLWRDAWVNEAECCTSIASIVRNTAPVEGHSSGTWPAIVQAT